MGILNAAQENPLTLPDNRLALLEYHADPHGLQCRHHVDAVVIAEHPENWPSQAGPQFRDNLETLRRRPVGLAAIVAGQDANVVFKIGNDADQGAHRAHAGICVQIAEMKDGKAVERRRKAGKSRCVSPQ